MDRNNAINAAKEYLDAELMPKISEIIPKGDFIIVVGGSLSYGFFDAESDVDVFIIWDEPRDKWLPKLREFLFMHKVIDGFHIQYIPLDLQSAQYAPLSCLLNRNWKLLMNNQDMKLFYDIMHFTTIHDTKGAVKLAQEFIDRLDSNYWKKKCYEHCCEHIDVLEAFYSSIKRNNALTGSLFYGNAIRGLLEIAYLAEGNPYPPSKWLWNGFEKVDSSLFDDLKVMLAGKLPETCEDMRNNVFGTTERIIQILKDNDSVPPYIIDALLEP